jgi:hypothetical protein
MLTTIDNPFDPFTQYDDWLALDEELARIKERPTTCSFLARITKTSDELSEEDEALAIESAIDEIVSQNVLGVYRKVSIDM